MLSPLKFFDLFTCEERGRCGKLIRGVCGILLRRCFKKRAKKNSKKEITKKKMIKLKLYRGNKIGRRNKE